ncbi:MAG: hypothetical protein AB1478_04630 [Nitrospirota bacterium]
MIYGYRVIREGEVGLYPAGLVQISIYRGWTGGIGQMLRAVSACRSLNLRYVIHPVGYFLSETRHNHRAETIEAMRTIAKNVDVALIIHDETTPWGTRLEGVYEEAYSETLLELSAICPVSIENANNTPDIKWFWRRFATSVTLDIGHVEAAGIDSERFVIELEADIIDKLNFVHIHRYNGLHDGLMDHWSLLEGCRELSALRRLLERKPNIGVILEINDRENLGKSLKLLEGL